MLKKELGAVLWRQRAAEIEALDLVAAVRGEEVELLPGLDALADDAGAQAVGHRDRGARDPRRARIGGQPADERAVELQRAGGETLQPAEVRVAAAEGLASLSKVAKALAASCIAAGSGISNSSQRASTP
jgi:hypothetical protein